MITVIGGVKTTVKIKLATPERDIEKQRKQDEEALLQAGIDLAGMNTDGDSSQTAKPTDESPEDARFRAFYEAKMREQASANYWDEVGAGERDFGGYPILAADNADIKVTSSGCSYTVAKLLGDKMDKKGEVAFASVVGNDALGMAAKSELEAHGVDVSHLDVREGSTAIGVELHNIIGDLEFCREDNRLLSEITPEFVDGLADVIEKSDGIFVDGTIPAETMNYISEKYSDTHRIFFDPASINGGNRLAESEMKAYCVVPGRMEAEAMTRQQVLGLDQLMAAGETLAARGVEKMVVTLKGGGLYYKDGAEAGIIKPARVLQFADTTGSGDVLTAELVYRLAQGDALKDASQKAIGAADEYLKDVEDVRSY